MKPYAVVFAGVPGSSKSIVAHYLSCQFDLPIFSHDQIRSEVKEDLQVDDINLPEALAEFHKRKDHRLNEYLATGRPIIIDNSVDRSWADRKTLLNKHGYEWFLIDMELSKEFLIKLFNSTGRHNFVVEQLGHYLKQHQAFIDSYQSDVDLFIRDEDFKGRTTIAAEDLAAFLQALQKQPKNALQTSK